MTSEKIKLKLISKLMEDGKKETSKRIIEKVTKEVGGWEIVENAIKKVCPKVITKSMQIGASTIPVPVGLSEEKQYSTGISWIIAAARKRSYKRGGIVYALISEIRDIKKEQGQAYRKKIETYRVVIANRASLNYRTQE